MATQTHVRNQYIATFVVNICSVAYGIFLGWPSVVQPMLQAPIPPVGSERFSNDVISWLGSAPFISSMIGNLFWGRVADKFGRKVTGYVSILPNILCYTLMLTTENQKLFILARFLGGFTNSAVASNTPMYIGEISEIHLRGKLASLYMLFANIGVFAVYVWGSFVSFYTLNVLCLMVSLLFLFMFYFLPESPVCLLKMNKKEQARDCVVWCRGENEEYVESELRRFNDSFVRAKKFSFKHLMKRTTLRGILIGFGLQAGIQLSGISVVLTYTVLIFQQSGIHELSPNYCTIIVGLLELIGSMFSSTFIEIAGRKKILVFTYLIMMIALFTLGTCFYVISFGSSISVGYIPLISLSSYMLAYPFGAGTIPYVMYSEIFASEVKNMSMSFIILWNNFLAFITVKVFRGLMDTEYRYWCFWFFSFCTFLAIIFVTFLVPETKGRPLLTVLQKLNGGKPLKVEPEEHCPLRAENGEASKKEAKENGKLKLEDHKVKVNGVSNMNSAENVNHKTRLDTE